MLLSNPLLALSYLPLEVRGLTSPSQLIPAVDSRILLTHPCNHEYPSLSNRKGSFVGEEQCQECQAFRVFEKNCFLEVHVHECRLYVQLSESEGEGSGKSQKNSKSFQL